MSVLLVGASSPLGVAVVLRLLAQGDEVRAIAEGPEAGELARHGVRVAKGPELDADLIERAAQNVRTIVSLEAKVDVLEPVVEGARAAGVDRVVVCAGTVGEPARDLLRGSGLEYVVLQPPRKGLFRKGVSDEALASAIDAADDMSGKLRLELDLNESEAWQTLNLEVPSGS